MNYDLLFAIIFYFFIFTIFLIYRKKFEVQNKIFVLYKTKLGIKLMDKLATKYPRFLKFLSYLSIFTGFCGMAFILYILIKGTLKLIMVPNTQPLLAPVLPGVKIAGLPVLSFWHWILSILFVAIVHEFSHGVYARLCNTKIKSSGFAFLGPILAAFVEPDEKQLIKKSKRDQLAVLSAGPFSNIISSIIILILTLLIVNPIAYSLVSLNGVQVNSLEKDFPAELSGMKVGEEILDINNITIKNQDDFSNSLSDLKPGDEILITTNVSSYKIVATKRADNPEKGYLGIVISALNVSVSDKAQEKYGNLIPMFILWFAKLCFWLYAINLGVGLFNLLPLGPVDGGRMFSVGISYFIKDDKKVNKIFSLMTLFCLLLIFINLLPYIIKLVMFIVKPILVFLI